MAHSRDQHIENALKSVYGDWGNPNFPLDLPKSEANKRYLWTDAFAIMTFTGLADRNSERSTEFLKAATSLRDTCLRVLGSPSDAQYPMKKRLPVEHKQEHHEGALSKLSPYIGLRIGKVKCRSQTDAGMIFDGQYAHYVDKFLMALTLLGDDTSLDLAEHLLLELAGVFVQEEGIHWKLNVDSTPVKDLGSPSVHGDTLSWAIVASMLVRDRPKVRPILDRLVALLHTSSFVISPTSDPLGWGLQLLELAHIEDCAWKHQVDIASMHSFGRICLDARQYTQLPFRLYGAIIGAKVYGAVSGVKALENEAEHTLLQVAAEEEAVRIGEGDHTSINRVMYALALDPSVLIKTRGALKL